MAGVVVLSVVLVVASVAIHLACLRGLLRVLPWLKGLGHLSVGVMVVGALVGHMVEIGLFGTAIARLEATGRHGTLSGAVGAEVTWADCYYYSAVTYTSLGFGDLTPTGSLRLLAAVEVLTGVALIAWTASFLFLVMQKSWGPAVHEALARHKGAGAAAHARPGPRSRDEAGS